MGKNKRSITLKGRCPICERTVNRFGCEAIKKPKARIKKEAKPVIKEPMNNDNSMFADLPLFSQ